MGKDEANTNPENMEADELPDVRAFEDEFTRSFLQSTEETRPGYYPFLSGTGAYRMDFPASGVIGEKGYGKNGDSFEGFLVGIINNSGTESSIKIDYLSYKEKGNESSNLEILKSQFNYDLKFKHIELEKRTIYLASFEDPDGVYGYAAYIQYGNGPGGVQIIYDTECTLSKSKCSAIKEEEKNNIVKWIKSIEFVTKKAEGE